MTDLEKMIEAFSVMDGVTKDVFQDKVGNYYVALIIARELHGTIFMYNEKEKFILMSRFGNCEFKTLDDFKKSCGAIGG